MISWRWDTPSNKGSGLRKCKLIYQERAWTETEAKGVPCLNTREMFSQIQSPGTQRPLLLCQKEAWWPLELEANLSNTVHLAFQACKMHTLYKEACTKLLQSCKGQTICERKTQRGHCKKLSRWSLSCNEDCKMLVSNARPSTEESQGYQAEMSQERLQ